MGRELEVANTREAKFNLVFELAGRLDLLPPVFVVSHHRAKDLPTYRTFPFLDSHGTLVVAEEEVGDYRAHHPRANIVTIPTGYAGLEKGVGRARQFCLDLASELGHEHILILDDDLVGAALLYGQPVSSAYVAHVGDRRAEFQRGLLVLASRCAAEAFEEDDKVALIGPQNRDQYCQRTEKEGELRWDLNRGRFPVQWVYWHVPRFREMAGAIDLENFNVCGEDLYAAMAVLNAGGSVGRIPAIMASYLKGDSQSVIRDLETAAAIRADEYLALRECDFAPYLRECRGKDGTLWGSAPDWRRLRKAGLAPIRWKLWDSTPTG